MINNTYGWVAAVVAQDFDPVLHKRLISGHLAYIYTIYKYNVCIKYIYIFI